MRVLGVDPGLGITGYGVIDAKNGGIKLLEAGVIRTNAKDTIENRLSKIYNGLKGLIEELKPEACVLEELYSHYKHPRTVISMAHARGTVALLCAECKLKLIGYSPKRIRKAVLGNGNASKEQIQQMIQNIFKLKSAPQPLDVTDALALAIGHVYMARR